jgi:hypothetical protein
MSKKDVYRKVYYDLRLVGLSKDEADNIEERFKTLTFKRGKIKNTEQVILLLKLHSRGKHSTFLKYIKENPTVIRRSNIWISIVSEKDMDGLTVPNYIYKIIKTLDCRIDFAFTVV